MKKTSKKREGAALPHGIDVMGGKYNTGSVKTSATAACDAQRRSAAKSKAGGKNKSSGY